MCDAQTVKVKEVQWVPGGILSLGIKWPGCKVDQSPPSSATVKNVWRYISTHPYIFMACSTKYVFITLKEDINAVKFTYTATPF
jgi:hypothetical protein